MLTKHGPSPTLLHVYMVYAETQSQLYLYPYGHVCGVKIYNSSATYEIYSVFILSFFGNENLVGKFPALMKSLTALSCRFTRDLEI